MPNGAARGTSPRQSLMQFIASMAGTLVVALFITCFNVQAFEIPTGSMERTLLVGDHLLVDRSELGPENHSLSLLPHHTIRDGDIVVFVSPAQPGLDLIKRVVGVPGDRIRLRAGVLIRNGAPTSEPYVTHNGTYNAYRDEFPAIQPVESDGVTGSWRQELEAHVRDGDLLVPDGSYFVMGDNRDNSYDSRYWGLVPQANLIGRPLLIYWSFDEPPDQYLKTSPSERLAYFLKVGIHFFDETRWQRMFKRVR